MAFSWRGRGLWTLAACALLAGASGLWLAAPGKAGTRLERPITIVVTFPPGGGTDLLARRAWRPSRRGRRPR
jgi:tripartite-type tricarboxylate transporter receptor subunit TctC